jgi:uncharacterized protein (UPF0261 family)
MVSTLAAGDVGRYVDVADISMMPSVTDLAGLNNISRTVLRNAACGIVGMASAGPAAGTGKPPIVLTMFGVTTPCVTAVTEQLRDRSDCIVFRATGTASSSLKKGSRRFTRRASPFMIPSPMRRRAMEKLADSAFLYGVIDVTTTEVYRSPARRGVLSAGADRLSAIARTRLPYVGSVGALRHGQFLGHRHVAGAVCGTQSPSPQPAGDVNAHDGRGAFGSPRSSIVATARSAVRGHRANASSDTRPTV